MSIVHYSCGMNFALDARLAYYRRYSGIGQYIVHLAERLPALDPDHTYTIIHSRKDRTPPHHSAARLVSAWTPSHHRFEQIAFPIELATRSIDLLHSPDFIPPFRGQYRRVITVHDLNFFYFPEFLTAESRRYYNDQIERAVTVADHILADSYATKLDLIKLLSVPEHKISAVWLAPDRSFSPIEPVALAAARARLNLPDCYILFTGTLEPRKNVAGLLRAYRQWRDRDAHAPALLLAGSRGWLFDETQALIHQLNLQDNVRWIDSPSAADLVVLYNAANVCVLPSHYEGFGLTVLEAMACGTPTIISDRGSLPEIAGGASLVVDPDNVDELAEALARAVADEDLRLDLRHKGFERVADFSWERCARETLKVYHQVLGQ